MKLPNTKGFFLIRPILILLAIVGAFGIWAYYQGYFKWRGPTPEKLVKEAAKDAEHSIKKIVK